MHTAYVLRGPGWAGAAYAQRLLAIACRIQGGSGSAATSAVTSRLQLRSIDRIRQPTAPGAVAPTVRLAGLAPDVDASADSDRISSNL